jgi:hypothetical protein
MASQHARLANFSLLVGTEWMALIEEGEAATVREMPLRLADRFIRQLKSSRIECNVGHPS